VTWWLLLSAAGAANIAAWGVLARRFVRTADPAWRDRRPHVVLAGIFAAVCAFRSWLPRADVQRIVLVDSFLSNVLVGRTVATIAELSFVIQWALLLREYGKDARQRPVVVIAAFIVPAITVAEVCSWYAVITTNFLGNAFEQSIWTLSGGLAGIAALLIRRRAAEPLRRRLGLVALGTALFVLFMTTVDVPMYLGRWRADSAAGRSYFGLADGLADLAGRWIVTFTWEDWHEELAWMAGYFTAAVWLSLSLARWPRFEAAGGAVGSKPERDLERRDVGRG
jgi:hypothetical protein